MGCALKDVRFTVRRSGDGDPAIYPRLLRDSAVLPKIALAIDYFEKLVGHERSDLDAELFVNFFGDHKLARCVIAALGRTYRFRARRISEVVSAASARRFAQQGIEAPKALRLALFDDVNERRAGVVAPNERDTAYADLAACLKVGTADVERVLYLDADEHAILRRVGPRARPDDVTAQFNVSALEMLLRQAEAVELRFRALTPSIRAVAGQVCAVHGIAIADEAPAQVLRLKGHQDALGVWSRHGRRLARVTLELLERGQADVVDGLALLALPGRRVRLRMTPEILAMLSTTDRGPAGWEDDLPAAEAVLQRVSAEVHRRPGTWNLRRLAEPQAWPAGVLLPDLLLRSANRSALLCAVRSVEHAGRLVRVLNTAAPAEPLVFVGTGEALAPLATIGANCLPLASFDIPALEAAVGSE